MFREALKIKWRYQMKFVNIVKIVVKLWLSFLDRIAFQK